MDILAEAYRRAKANGGTRGVDGEQFEDVERHGISEYLSELQTELKQRQYVLQPVRRVYIPKANGKKRPLGIPTVRDRIVQTAFVLILEPIFEADFTASSHGFRPNKSAHGAIRDIYKYTNWGCEQIYDFEKYFDTVEHWKLDYRYLIGVHPGLACSTRSKPDCFSPIVNCFNFFVDT
jgi:retron-type reverse transcriptase